MLKVFTCLISTSCLRPFASTLHHAIITYHAVLSGQHVCGCGISLKQRPIQSKALCSLVKDNWLQLTMVANQYDLLRATRYDRHQALCLFTHATLVYNNLKQSHVHIHMLSKPCQSHNSTYA